MVRRKSDASSRASTPRVAKSDISSDTHVLVNKYRRGHRQSHVLNEIRYLRRSIKLLIPKAPFARLVREIIMDLFPSTNVNRIQAKALEAMQEAAEAYIVQFFEDCILLSMHAKRVTIMIQDMLLMRRLRGRTDVINR